LPGIRIGYGLGSRKLVEKLTFYQVPWSCNRVAQKLGGAVLRDEAFQEESREWLKKERDWFEFQFRELSSLKVYPSGANFFLARHLIRPGRTPLVEEMGKEGIYLRDLSEFPGLGPSYFRVGIRTREENERLMAALRVWSSKAVETQSAGVSREV